MARGPERDRRALACRAGNESTSVGPCLSLNLRFIRAMTGSLTKQMVTLSSGKPSSRCTRSENLAKDFTANGMRRWRFKIIPADPGYRLTSDLAGSGLFAGPLAPDAERA